MECFGLPIPLAPPAPAARGPQRNCGLPHKWGNEAGGRGSRCKNVGCDVEKVAACLLLGRGLNRIRRGLRHVVSRAHLYRSIWGVSSLNKYLPGLPTRGGLPPAPEARGPQWTRGGRGNSDLGGQLGVLLFVDQVLELPWIFDADAQQPPRAIRLGVDDIRVIERLGV